jgi:hypothetical protein
MTRCSCVGILIMVPYVVGATAGFAATDPIRPAAGESLPYVRFAIHADSSALPDADREEALEETVRV